MLEPLITGVVMALSAALIGVVLVLKRNAMIADGLAHVGVGALAIAGALGLAPLPVALPVVIIASVFILRLSENHHIHGDSAIALTATSALAVGVLVSSLSGADAEELEQLLLGDIAAVGGLELVLTILLGVVIITIFLANYQKIFAVTFDENFAEATGLKPERYNLLFAVLASVLVVLGMRLVGSLLISSLAIFPVLTAESVFRTFRSVLLASAVISVVTFTAGFLVAWGLGWPIGATVVLTSLVGLVGAKVVGRSFHSH